MCYGRELERTDGIASELCNWEMHTTELVRPVAFPKIVKYE